jgi:methylated-DNA-[protein]-cysteine S-methyltransferase
MFIQKAYMDTPLGWLEIGATDEGVKSIMFLPVQAELSTCCPGFNSYLNITNPKKQLIGNGLPDCLNECMFQIDEYFAGKRREFDLLLNPKGTEFQKRVWAELEKIKYGDTVSYHDIAERIGNEKSVRAVGNANHKNPLPIVVPCHRVIGKNGKLKGYAGSVWRKRWLLEFEKFVVNED